MMFSSETSVASGNVDAMSTVAPQCLIYGLVDPRTLMVRYVGLTKRGLRRAESHINPSKNEPNRHKKHWIQQLKRHGLQFVPVVLQLSTIDALGDDERWWIAYGRTCGWPLTNLSDGGSYSPLERTHPDSTKKKIGDALRGRKRDPSIGQKIAARLLARPESKRQASAAAGWEKRRLQPSKHVRPTSCPHGHAYTNENARIRRGRIECKTCGRIRRMERYYKGLS